MEFGFLTGLTHAFFYIALAAWTATFAGMLYTLTTSFTALGRRDANSGRGS